MKFSFRTFSASAILFLVVTLNVLPVTASDSVSKNDTPPISSADLTIWNDMTAVVDARLQDAMGALVTEVRGKDLVVLVDGTVRSLLIGGDNWSWVSVVVDRASNGTVTRVAHLDGRAGDQFAWPNRLSRDGRQAMGASGKYPTCLPVVWDVLSGRLTERVPTCATGDLSQTWDISDDGAILADDGRGGAWIHSNGGAWTQLTSYHPTPVMKVSAYRFTHTGQVAGCDHLRTDNQMVPTLWNTDGSKAGELPRGSALCGQIWSTAPGAATYGGEVQQASTQPSQAALWIKDKLYRVLDRQGNAQEGKITAILDDGVGVGCTKEDQTFLVLPNEKGGFTAISIKEWAAQTFDVATGPLTTASALVRSGNTIYLQTSSDSQSFTLKFPAAALLGGCGN